MESGIQNKLVAELFLPIPEPSHISGRVELESFEFSSDQQVFYKHEGVGSGEYTSVNTKQKSNNINTGKIINLFWNISAESLSLYQSKELTVPRSRYLRTVTWPENCILDVSLLQSFPPSLLRFHRKREMNSLFIDVKRFIISNV